MPNARTSARAAAAAGALAAAVALALPAAAPAIPWDRAGAIPPSATPPPALPDPLCRQSYADDDPRGGARLRFGVGPRLAGEVGARQVTPLTPENPARRDAALRRLRGGSVFVVRLNRLFSADGERGIRRFRAMARRYGRLGLEVELQVRYHPRPQDEGDMRAWLRFVDRVVRAFGPLPYVTGLQITNEVNLALSPNTSDGAFRGALQALVRGVIRAKALSRAEGHDQLRIGFNYAWRFDDERDAAFWEALGREGGRALRRATDWIGLDAYPGTFAPPRAQIADMGDAFLEALAQTRECYLPKAGFGRSVPLRVEETGWPTGPGRPEEEQRRNLRAIVRTAHAYRGTYGITDLRWFNLRDNTARGPNFQSFFGLLRDDYSPKPAFGEYRALVRALGRRR